MTRTIAGLPIWAWGVGVAGFVGGLWYFKKHTGTTAGTPKAGASAAPAFSQQQEIQDFQIYSQLSSAQQAADLSLVGQFLSLFGAGGGGRSSGGGGTGTPAPPASPGPPGGTVNPPHGTGIPEGTGGNPGKKGTWTLTPGGGSGSTVANPSTGAPGLVTTTINGVEYYVLGGQQGHYNVTGGAPVVATWTGQGTPQQGFNTTSWQPGEVLYTPVTTPLNQIGNYATTGGL